MTRRQRGQAPTGMQPSALFWTRDGDEQPDTPDNPRLRPCPWPPCRALAGQPCTVTTGRGRRKPITGYHSARTVQTGDQT